MFDSLSDVGEVSDKSSSAPSADGDIRKNVTSELITKQSGNTTPTNNEENSKNYVNGNSGVVFTISVEGAKNIKDGKQIEDSRSNTNGNYLLSNLSDCSFGSSLEDLSCKSTTFSDDEHEHRDNEISLEKAPPFEMKEQTAEESNNKAVSGVRESLDRAGEMLFNFQKTCNAREDEIAKLQQQLNEVQTIHINEVDRLQKDVNYFERSENRLNHKLELYENKNKKLQNDIVQCKEESTKKLKTVVEQKMTIETLNKNETSLKQQIKNIKEEQIRLQNLKSKLSQELALEATRNLKLENENQSLMRQNKNLLRENEHLSHELETTEKQLDESNREIRKLRGNIQEIENKVQRLTHNIASLSDEKALIWKKNNELNDNLRLSMESCTRARHEKTQLINENEEKLLEIRNLLLTIEEIKGEANNEKSAFERELMMAREHAANLELRLVTMSDTPRARPLMETSEVSDIQRKLEESEKKNRELRKYLKMCVQDKKINHTTARPTLSKFAAHDVAGTSAQFENFNVAEIIKERDDLLRRVKSQDKKINKLEEKIKTAFNATSQSVTINT